jgi:hypothetical protein
MRIKPRTGIIDWHEWQRNNKNLLVGPLKRVATLTNLGLDGWTGLEGGASEGH